MYKRYFVYVILFIVFLGGLEQLCHRATDGFTLANIYAPYADNSQWKNLDSIDPTLLNQTYHYLNCGSQSYAFVSEDGKTVLKLFKFQHMRTPPWLNFLPSIGILGAKRKKKRAVLENAFTSYLIAYDYLKDSTALLYLHLAKTDHLKQTLTITDKIGRHYTLELDSVEFVLQKRGTLVYDTITSWVEQGEKEKAKKGIQKLLNLSINRCKAGIFDKDPDFSTNFGFIGDTPFQIDCGQFSLSEEEKSAEVYRPEMICITQDFETWIANHHPDLLEDFRKELHETIFD